MTGLASSVFDSPPIEAGGVHNRIGIEFQDHVAAKHCLDMLDDAEISQVWHEYHDDILVIRGIGDNASAEYIQVKNTDEPLWSVAALTRREKKLNPITRKKEDVEGSSILEKNLDNDKRVQTSLFRMVTSKEINKDLKVLGIPRHAPGRDSSSEAMKSILIALNEKIGGYKSENGNGYEYWASNVIWDVYTSADLLASKNKLLVQSLAEAEGFNLKTFECDAVYKAICDLVRVAGLTKASENPAIKKFLREDFKSKFLELIKQSIVPTSLYEGMGDFDLSFEYLKDIIYSLHEIVHAEETIVIFENFKLIDMAEKNKINGMTKEFYENLFSSYGQHFIKIRRFLSLPINLESNEKYQDLSNEVSILINQYRGSVSNFDDLILQLCRMLTNGPRADADLKKRYVWVLISYMYYNCDIGRRE